MTFEQSGGELRTYTIEDIVPTSFEKIENSQYVKVNYRTIVSPDVPTTHDNNAINTSFNSALVKRQFSHRVDKHLQFGDYIKSITLEQPNITIDFTNPPLSINGGVPAYYEPTNSNVYEQYVNDVINFRLQQAGITLNNGNEFYFDVEPLYGRFNFINTIFYNGQEPVCVSKVSFANVVLSYLSNNENVDVDAHGLLISMISQTVVVNTPIGDIARKITIAPISSTQIQTNCNDIILETDLTDYSLSNINSNVNYSGQQLPASRTGNTPITVTATLSSNLTVTAISWQLGTGLSLNSGTLDTATIEVTGTGIATVTYTTEECGDITKDVVIVPANARLPIA